MLRRAAVLTYLVALVATACSGSDGDSSTTPAPPPDLVTDVVATEPIDSNTAEPADSAEGPSASVAEFCTAISAIQSAEFELEETFGPAARQLFDDVQAAAPPEIADDVAIVIETLDAIAEVGISADENDPEAIDAAFEILLDPDFTEANERLEEYTSQACGIDLGDGDETDLEVLELDDIEG